MREFDWIDDLLGIAAWVCLMFLICWELAAYLALV